MLGLDAPGQVIVPVRRFLCCACMATTSVLPDVLYPGRWYGAWVILEALVLAFALGVPIDEVRREFGVEADTRGWRSLDRWRRELLAPLWGWLAGGLGAHGDCERRDEARRRLVRVLGQVGARPARGEGARVAPILLHGRVHDRASSWLAAHARPGAARRESPS